ncbi:MULTISPECIES: phosphotransferase family protein [unclassified Fusibacter]|uniref:phosphotransferase family protein n=1 Tax=unclassified Fusibacter TaxID=2624464 RepID=UPI0013E90EB5|nr:MULTISPECIES: aminoglycoside phosphotransferase family protein [unclassified Fusibacter]MCK8060253.1 aminoglycoside phosphotransferase family protein [Fusibacter sp. A2]NPE20459.1 aminoglycoside phosphotransferase family protein [Fusibacter sp. A1]
MTSDKTVAKLIREFKLDVSTISPVPESFSSTVHMLELASGQKVILKIPYSKSKLHREKPILESLQGKLPVPKLLNFWEGDEDITGALLLSYIDGEPIVGPVSEHLAYDMGRLLAEMHQIPMKDFELVEGVHLNWWDSVKTRFYEWYSECEGHLDDNFLKRCASRFEEMFINLPPADGPAMIHFDYRPGNILVKDKKIVGLIDFESSRGGSRDIDFTKVKVYMWDLYKGTKESFISGYTSIRALPDISNTLDFYLFFNGFGGLAWCIRRNKTDDEFFTENYEQVCQYL